MRLAAAALAYFTLAGVLVYGVLEPDRLAGTQLAPAGLVAIVAGIHLAVGLLAARWWAVALPVLAIFLAVPAGYPDFVRGEPLPIWLGIGFMLPIAVPAVAAGVLVAELEASRRRAIRSS